jgi:hypothetical protein
LTQIYTEDDETDSEGIDEPYFDYEEDNNGGEGETEGDEWENVYEEGPIEDPVTETEGETPVEDEDTDQAQDQDQDQDFVYEEDEDLEWSENEDEEAKKSNL